MGGGHPGQGEAEGFLRFPSVVKWAEVPVGGGCQLGGGMSVACDGSGGDDKYKKCGPGQLLCTTMETLVERR